MHSSGWLACEQTLGILNDILDFSKIEANKLRFEHSVFDLDEVFLNLSRLFTSKAEEKGIRFVLDRAPAVPCKLVGDALRLGQVLINLTGNALKFTDQGQVTVGVRLVESTPQDVRLHFHVRDTGVGLDETQAALLFQPFTQADTSTSRKYGGTGLGLAISKQLVEMMDGTIGVRSRLHEGSEFHFTARFEQPPEVVGQCRVAPALGACPRADACLLRNRKEGSRSYRALVVDDSDVARDSLCSMLKSLQFSAHAVASGQEAIEELRRTARSAENAYDLVLIDWRMPDMDGFEAIRRIRSDIDLPTIPKLILVTAYSLSDMPPQVRQMRTDGILFKPCAAQTLCEVATTALGIHGPSEASTAQKAEELLSGSVLLADDNEMNRIVAKDMLETLGLDVTVVDNGQDAIDACLAEHFDLLLMDIEMPGMDGFEATRRIRGHLDKSRLPILATTAHALRSVHERCLAEGMNGHIDKPIELDQLRQRLAQWLPTARRVAPVRTMSDEDSRVALPETDPAFDTRAALARLGNKRAAYRRILLEYGNEHRDKEAIILEAIARGDLSGAQRTLHSLKGISGNLGMVDLYRAIANLESCLRNEEPHATETTAFREAFRAVMHALDELSSRKEKNETTQGRFDSQSIGPLLAALSDLVREGSPRAADVVLELQTALAGKNRAMMDMLAVQVESFDFDAAEETLEALIETLRSEMSSP